MRLVYKATQQPVKLGDPVRLWESDWTVTYFREPHKPDSEGKVTIRLKGEEEPSGTELYVSIIGAEWIEREDRSPSGADAMSMAFASSGMAEDPPADFDPEFPAAPHDDEADAHQRERNREGRAS
jgi:hypothetical protein